MPDPLWLNGTVPPDSHTAQLATFRDGRGEPVMHWPTRLIPSTTVIIWHPYDPRTVFCHQRSDNHWWGFVGGGQHIGESIEACALRETQEETGWLITLDRLVCIDSDPTQGAICAYPDGGCVQYMNVTFTAHLAGRQPRIPTLSAESVAWGWFSITNLPPPFLPSHAWRLQQVFPQRVCPIPYR